MFSTINEWNRMRKLCFLGLVGLLGGLTGCVHSHVIDNKNSYEPVKFNTLHSSDTTLRGESTKAEGERRWWRPWGRSDSE